MKLEVGMICRTYDGYIGKLIQINVSDYNYLVIDCNRDVRRDVGYPKSHLYLKEENIKKASHDILDLIEVGDFITYKKNNLHIEYPCRVYGSYNEEIGETELYADNENLKNIKITSIVAHEQFTQIEYKIG